MIVGKGRGILLTRGGEEERTDLGSIEGEGRSSG